MLYTKRARLATAHYMRGKLFDSRGIPSTIGAGGVPRHGIIDASAAAAKREKIE
jgi:hypothetical protein